MSESSWIALHTKLDASGLMLHECLLWTLASDQYDSLGPAIMSILEMENEPAPPVPDLHGHQGVEPDLAQRLVHPEVFPIPEAEGGRRLGAH
mgnify:CR=1 FL=1